MAVSDQITRIGNAVAQIITALINKGVSVPTDTKIDAIGPYITSVKVCYVGTTEPSSSVGEDGDIYIKKG